METSPGRRASSGLSASLPQRRTSGGNEARARRRASALLSTARAAVLAASCAMSFRQVRAEISSLPAELRLALLQEGGDALAVVFALANLALQVAFHIKLRRQCVSCRGIHRFL